MTTGASEGCGGGVAKWRSSFRIYVPSPTTSWYSGPVGCVKILLVSIIGAACPLATARLYAACDGYLGGGGRTLFHESYQRSARKVRKWQILTTWRFCGVCRVQTDLRATSKDSSMIKSYPKCLGCAMRKQEAELLNGLQVQKCGVAEVSLRNRGGTRRRIARRLLADEDGLVHKRCL